MINLREFELAKPKLEALSYDSELGNVAQQALERIEQELAPQKDETINTQAPQERPAINNDIVVQLLRSGSSFLVDTNIEQSPARLLLDTGCLLYTSPSPRD